jgi:tRNA/tmRNA/rRNA uracil-C5-methylase (TrmA/RlmC/RlmD family)
VHELRGRTWRQGADEFWQVHADLPEALVEAVLDLGAPAPEEAWWDLYSGAGLFAAFLGEAVGPEGRVEAVESSAPAVRSARRALHDQPQVRLHLGDVASWVRGRKDSPAGVVLDPPRAGAGPGIVEAIAATAAARILYVACDPVALGRDTARLAACGYRLTALRAFDAFPMTHHFEVVALVRRSTS